MAVISFYLFLFTAITISTISEVNCWDNEDLELFDLVEEINKNFYEVLNVQSSATVQEIKRAYRKLTLQLHPDRNKEADAEIKFRQLAAVYEILKDEERRKSYDDVLEHGLPDWKQPVFYYRRVRKMGLVEMSLLLMVILTVGHFLVIWSMYLERRFELEEVFRSKKKRSDKKSKRGKSNVAAPVDEEDILQEELSYIPKPRLLDLLPIKICKGLIVGLITLPGEYKKAAEERERIRREAEEIKAEEERAVKEMEEEKEQQKIRRRKKAAEGPEPQPEFATSQAPVVYKDARIEEALLEEKASLEMKQIKTGISWEDEDYLMLSKAFTRFPGGTQDRWEKIADMVGRPVNEVIANAKKRKSNYVTSVDPSAQGLTASANVTLKKGQLQPSDDIISTNDSSVSITDTESGHRKNNNKKKSDRTLLPQQEKDTKTFIEIPTSKTQLSDGANHKKKSVKSDVEVKDTSWSQNQQKLLEWALNKFPKGTEERWDKVAEHIPGKNKDDCIIRVKYLAEVVRKRKQKLSDDVAAEPAESK